MYTCKLGTMDEQKYSWQSMATGKWDPEDNDAPCALHMEIIMKLKGLHHHPIKIIT